MNLYSIVELSIRDSGKQAIDMVMVFKSGQMGPSMKDTGKTIKHTEKESSGILMEMYLTGNGVMTKLMGTEFIHMLMEQSTKENGKMTYNVEEGWKFGLMDLNMKECTKTDRNMVKENIFGLIIPVMKGTGLKIKFVEE
jgi:hypothetical protein